MRVDTGNAVGRWAVGVKRTRLDCVRAPDHLVVQSPDVFPEGMVSLRVALGLQLLLSVLLRNDFKSAPGEAPLHSFMNQSCSPLFLVGFTWMSIWYPKFKRP